MRTSHRLAIGAACIAGAIALPAQELARATTTATSASANPSAVPDPTPARTHDEGTTPPIATTTAPTAITSQYLLGVSDVLRITVWKSPELSQTVTIGPDGFISLPLLGDIHAAGRTAEQLAKELTGRLGSYVVSPQVTVSVTEFLSRQVFVTGQVGKPGAYSLIAPVTVLQLIARAGGLTSFANRKGIFVLRNGQAGATKLKFNYTTALRGDVAQNIILAPGDTLIVP